MPRFIKPNDILVVGPKFDEWTTGPGTAAAYYRRHGILDRPQVGYWYICVGIQIVDGSLDVLLFDCFWGATYVLPSYLMLTEREAVDAELIDARTIERGLKGPTYPPPQFQQIIVRDDNPYDSDSDVDYMDSPELIYEDDSDEIEEILTRGQVQLGVIDQIDGPYDDIPF